MKHHDKLWSVRLVSLVIFTRLWRKCYRQSILGLPVVSYLHNNLPSLFTFDRKLGLKNSMIFAT